MMILPSFFLTTGACSSNNAHKGADNSVSVPDPSPKPGGGRSLVVYFSCTNTTKRIAQQIAEVTGGTLHRILPEVGYTAGDLNYNDPSSRANREQNDPSSRPAISSGSVGADDYDVIFLGYPIWWGKAPKIILTFLEGQDLSGKIVIPFCTSGSSGLGSSDADLHGSAPRAAWKAGRRFSAGAAKDDIEKWIEGMDLEF